MRSEIQRFLSIMLAIVATVATAGASDAAPCSHTQKTDESILVTANARPLTRIVVDLHSDKGRSLTITFDASHDAPLVHEIRLPGTAGDVWTISATGDRAAFATPDGRGSVFMAYLPEGCSGNQKISLKPRMLVLGLNKTKWAEVEDAIAVDIEVATKTVRLERLGLADAVVGTNSLVPSTRGLDSAIPDAVRETLSLLADIAVDRAKAEGARLLKDRIQEFLCNQLTFEKVLPATSFRTQRLLPATCGQLDNLRFSDLGASANGLVHALREDLVDVVVPALLDALPLSGSGARLRSPTARAVVRIAASAVRRGFTPDSVRLAAFGLLDLADLPAPLARTLRVAIQCTKQDCSVGDIRLLLQEITTDLLGAANIPASLAPLITLAVNCATKVGQTGCTGADLKTEIGNIAVSSSDIAGGVPEPLRRAVALGVRCSTSTCTTDDLTNFVAELAPIVAISASVPAKLQPVVNLTVKCMLRGCLGSDLQSLVAGLTNLAATDVDVPETVREALNIAVKCAAACTANDVTAFVSAMRVVDPFWIDATLRMITIVRPRGNVDGSKLGGELVDLLLDIVKHGCADKKCELVVTALRDITVGVIEADYLRALGGVQAAFVATDISPRLKGKPFELAASIASYVSTYRETKDKDATIARDLRKQALEGLIDAATDRSNRAGDWIVSLGASVGFSAGRRYLGSDLGEGIRHKQSLRDLRLPLGITVQRMPAEDTSIGWGVYGMLGFADLAQFVSSPVEQSTTDQAGMATSTTSVATETTWSDFVAFEGQLGFRFGSARIPLTVGLDFYYRPRVWFEVDGTSRSTNIWHVGAFAGFNVPFFDFN